MKKKIIIIMLMLLGIFYMSKHQVQAEEAFTYQMPDIYEPETGIINPATTIQVITSRKQFDDALKTIRPATLLFKINDDLDIVTEEGFIIDSINEVLSLMNGKAIPAFQIYDEDVAIELVNRLKTLNVKDFFVISSDQNLLINARKAYHYTRAVLDLSDLEVIDHLIDIRDLTNRAQATAVILPLKHVNLKDVTYLQQRLITVWTLTNGDQIEHYEAILSGVNGIITSDFSDIFDIYTTFPENSMVRKVSLIAHRALSSYSPEGLIDIKDKEPENSVYATDLAIERGAEIIELDLHITKDNHVVVHHDNDTGRYFDGNLVIAQSNLSELQALNFKFEAYADTKIITFDEYMSNFIDAEVVFFIEIKSWVSNTDIVNQVNDTLNRYNMKDRAVIISFVPFHMIETRKVMPELSTGLLAYNMDVIESVETVLNHIMPYPATLNHSFIGLTEARVRTFTHRGITLWPWTINDARLDTYVLTGVGGVTTDTLNYYADDWLGFELYETDFTYDIYTDNKFRILGQQTSLSGKSYEIVPDYVVLDDGNTGIELDRGSVVRATQPGIVKIMVSMTTKLPNQTAIVLYNNIVTIEVIDTEPELVEQEQTVLPIILGISGIAVIGALGTLVYLKKKGRL